LRGPGAERRPDGDPGEFVRHWVARKLLPDRVTDEGRRLPLAIAHRGDPRAAPENTIGAFRAAVDAGADMVELDLKAATDGTIVVVHDDELDRVFGVEGTVSLMSAAELAKVTRDGWGIPTLREVLVEVTVPLMVDFTEGNVVEGALREALLAGALHRCLFVTENVAALRDLRRRATRSVRIPNS
jgi:glycerophosphoryl diester phosphodiesterase